ncbi:hypothetical protein LguiB_020281 [Lonicera macranthoides]
MEVESVVAVVKQKLTDLLKEEAVCRHKAIVLQLKSIKKSLDKIPAALRNAEDQTADQMEEEQQRQQHIAKQRTKYLRIVYQVEDEIERFSFRLARQSKTKGFLTTINNPFFCSNLNSFNKLRRKMKRTVSGKSTDDDDEEEEEEEPEEDGSINSKLSQRSLSINSGNNNINKSTNSSLNRSSGPGSMLVSIKEDNQTVSCYSDEEEVNHNLVGFREKSFKRQSSFSDGVEKFFGFKPEPLKHPKKMSSFSYGEEELGILGFKEHVDKLVKRLTRKGDRVVPIFGEVGSGKTTLARAVYRSRDIKQWFQFRAWVPVLKDYTETDVLLSLVKQLNGGCTLNSNSNSKDQGVNRIPEQLPQLKIRLFEMLKEKRYLVVLDDLHAFHLWEELKVDFPNTNNGSKIIFTTCDHGTNSKIQHDLPHSLKGLSDLDSWDLFLKKVDNPLPDLSPDVEQNVKPKILKICNGRPLYIELLGGLLSTKKVEDWSSSAPLSSDNSDVLWLCFNDLPIYYKLCLLYLVLFPKQVYIPVRRLLRLWLAEGFVDRLVDSSSPNRVPVQVPFPEDVILKCFEDLVNRNMIQISKLRSDNSPKKCHLIGALHDYLLPKAQEISLFYIHRNLDYNKAAAGPFGIRRMVEYADIKGVFGQWPMKNNGQQQGGENAFVPSSSCFCFSSGMQQSQKREGIKNLPSYLRSYLSFNLQKKDTVAREVGRFLSRIVDSGFGLLRVLDLEGVYKPSLPHKLGDLHNLRYLGLRWTFLDTLPQSVGDLPYLETLDVKHTYINQIPNSIWKAKHLRHLNLNDIRLDMPKTQPDSFMTLLTLWGLFVDKKSLVRNGLDMLVNLRELGITFHLSSSQSDFFVWIERLAALQSLRLRSKDDRGRPSELCWTISLSHLEKLSNLNLLGNLPKLPCYEEFPPNLKVLTLSVSRLEEDPMPTLGKLPKLSVLRLLANSYLGSKMVCSRETFPSLQVLKLWMLQELAEWNVEERAMQKLKELNIRCCGRLKNIPHTLLQLRDLDELILTNMPKDFIDTVRQRKSKQTSLTINTNWEFTPLPVSSC